MRLLGIDIGTSSSKGVLVDESGTVLATATHPHRTSSPAPGWYEHDADALWWGDVVTLTRELLATSHGVVDGIAVSGIGPAVLLTDADQEPVRPAILYGIDTRSQDQIVADTERLGEDAILAAAGNLLTTQAVGPKLSWVAQNEPEVWARVRHLHSAPSWVVHRLTAEYVMDHYSASNSDPLYDLATTDWWQPAWVGLEQITRPRLAWPGEIVGHVHAQAAAETGLTAGVPVLAGTIDALAEAYSVGVRDVGDAMVMYGSTLFMVQVVPSALRDRGLWSAVGRTPEVFSACAGLSTSGLITGWLSELTGRDFPELIDEARAVPAGCDGLMLLPYFEGERTPIFDPLARGTWVGLTLRHGRGHLYRSALEGVAHGLRHILDTMDAAGGSPARLVAVGGGTKERLWTQIVSDVTGLPQDIPTLTIGASYGDARMVADALGVDTAGWNPVVEQLVPDPSVREVHDLVHAEYLRTYPAIAETMHTLATLNR